MEPLSVRSTLGDLVSREPECCRCGICGVDARFADVDVPAGEGEGGGEGEGDSAAGFADGAA